MFVGSIYMTVWGNACDSILQCFCIDKELNTNGDRFPKNIYCPNKLIDFLEGKQVQDQIQMQTEMKNLIVRKY